MERWAVLAGGLADELPAVELDPPYRTATTPSDDPSHLIGELHTRMRRAEGELASALAADAFVVADGPLNKPLAPLAVVGYIKSHRVTYLPPEQNAVIAELAPGQRTPLFTIAADRPDVCRYSWYVRLAMLHGGHSWTGIVRCEASGKLPKDDVQDDRRPHRRAAAARRLRAAHRPARAAEPGADRRARARAPSPDGRSRAWSTARFDTPSANARRRDPHRFLPPLVRWLSKCSIATSDPGYTSPVCPSLDHRTR